MLDSLKRDLKNLVAKSSIKELFRRLTEEVLVTSSKVYDDLIIIKARYTKAERSDHLGTINFENKDLTFNTVNEALLWIISRIECVDLNTTIRQQIDSHSHIPLIHASTCNRFKQDDQFQLNYYDDPGPENRIRFFYLYGDARQNHQSLFERLGHDLAGALLNWEAGECEPQTKIYFSANKPKAHRNPVMMQINVLRELWAKFFPGKKPNQPIRNIKLSSLLTSPKLKNYGKDDFVFVLLTMDDYNWNEKQTPALIKSFMEGFCNDELLSDAPAFFFFFGIEYKKENIKVMEQVKVAMDNSSRGETLPILTPLPIEDVAEWFSRYTPLIIEGQEADDMVQRYFSNKKELDMADVEIKLKEIIENYNKGFLIN